MAKILVNYIHNKTRDEYEILRDSRYVFAEMPAAVLETEDDIKVPLVVPMKGTMVVVDRARYEMVNKKFKLVADEKGNVSEAENGAEIWLPRNTDVSKLKYINNQLVMIADDEKSEEEPKTEKETEKNAEKKSQPKKNKKTN